MKSLSLQKNITSLGIVQIANYVFPLITIPIISRIVGPEKFGILNYSSIFVSYFTILVTYGFDITATRRVAKDSNNNDLRNKVFSEVLISKLFLFSVSIIIFIPCLFSVQLLSVDKRVSIFSFFIVFSNVFSQNWMFQAMQEISKVSILNLLGKAISAISIIILIKNPDQYYWQALSLSLSLSSIFISIISFFWSIKRYNLIFKKVRLSSVLKLLKEEKSIFISMVVVSLYTTTNTIMLGILRPAVEVGYYSAAQKLMTVATSVINIPISQSLFPHVGSSFGISIEDGIKKLQKYSVIIILFLIVSTLSMLIIGPYVMLAFYGENFSPAIGAFQIICFIPLIVGINNILGIQTMLNLNMDKVFFQISLVGAGIGLCLNYVMINNLGYIGTGLNWVIVELLITGLMYFYLRKKNIYPIILGNFKIKEVKNIIFSLRKKA